MIRIEQTKVGDFAVTTDSSGRIEEGDSLVTALAISFFTRRSHPATTGPNGWWANRYLRRPIGSHLHLVEGAKVSEETMSRARYSLLTASQWTIERGVFAKRDIEVTSSGLDGVCISFVGYRADGTRWEHVWKEVSLNDL